MTQDAQPIEQAKGRPLLQWYGKQPLTRIAYYPAQEKEVYGDRQSPHCNRLYWGDNLQVLGHLLKTHRGRIDLIYIDPPFDSKADYVKTIKLRGALLSGEAQSLLEEKQYSDLWARDEYLQFMYERLLLMKELLADNGVLYLHCDHRKDHHLRLLLDEIFGEDNFLNAIAWRRGVIRGRKVDSTYYPFNRDTLLIYARHRPAATWHLTATKGETLIPEQDYRRYGYKKDDHGYYIDSARNDYSDASVIALHRQHRVYVTHGGELHIDAEGHVSTSAGQIRIKAYRAVRDGHIVEVRHTDNIWDDIRAMGNNDDPLTDYPTQKPEALLERIIAASTNPGALVADFFMGSGTTCAVAQRLGRRWLGCDINRVALQTASRRLSQVIAAQTEAGTDPATFTGALAFKVLNVNDYEVFRSELEARELVLELYGVEPLKGSYFDGLLDRQFVKVMPLNRVLNKQDLRTLLEQVSSQRELFTVQTQTRAGEPLYAERVLVICSGMELDVPDTLRRENSSGVEIVIRDLLTDQTELVFKEPPEAAITCTVQAQQLTVTVQDFHAPLLLRKLELANTRRLDPHGRAQVADFRQLLDSVAIDPDYDGQLFSATVLDIPGRQTTVSGRYTWDYPRPGRYTVAVKLIDVLGEEYFETFNIIA